MNEICKCSFCGYEWLRGRDGSHDCYEAMTKTIKSQAETIERLKKLVKAVKYDDSEGCWRAEWIIGETWQEYRDNLLKELEEG